MQPLNSGPMVIRVKSLDTALRNVRAFLTENDDEYTIDIYRYKGNKIYDLICDGNVELRIIIVGG